MEYFIGEQGIQDFLLPHFWCWPLSTLSDSAT